MPEFRHFVLVAVALLAFGVNFYNRRQETGSSSTKETGLQEKETALTTTILTPSTQPPAFFNREEEKRILSKLFNDETKRTTVLMGPPSVGKSALITEVLKGFPNSAYIDLRDLDRGSVMGALFGLFRQSQKSWVEQMAKVTSGKFKFLWKGVGASLNIAPSQIGAQTSFLDWVKLFLEELNTYGKENPAILVIDEANRLKELYTIDHVFVADLLSLLIKVSKQTNQVSVVLTTSDSFFLEWLAQVGVAHHATTMTLGDLTKEGARGFFDTYKQAQHSNISFDEVFGAFGGRMVSIKDFLFQPQSFDVFPRATMFFHHLSVHSNPSSKAIRLTGDSKPGWTEKEFVDIVRILVNSPVHAMDSEEHSSFSSESLSDLVSCEIQRSVLPTRP